MRIAFFAFDVVAWFADNSDVCENRANVGHPAFTY